MRRLVIQPISPLVTMTQLKIRPVAHRHMDMPALTRVSRRALVSIFMLKRFRQMAMTTQ